MDATLQALFNLLPAKFQPYVLIGLIFLYVITKWRSENKSAQLHNKEFMRATALAQTGAPSKGLFSRLVDFVF